MDTEYNGHFIVRPETVAEGGEKGPGFKSLESKVQVWEWGQTSCKAQRAVFQYFTSMGEAA